MTVLVVATVGAADANSYLTVADASALLSARLFTDAWTRANSLQHAQGLITATAYINRLPWKGIRTKGAPTQALSWPRGYCPDPDQAGVSLTSAPYLNPLLQYIAFADSIIPGRIQLGTALLANFLLGCATDPFLPSASANVKREKFGPMETEYIDPLLLLRGFDLVPEVWAQIGAMVDTAGRSAQAMGSGAGRVVRG